MDATMGQWVYLPAGVAGSDPDAFLSDVLTGRRRAQLAQNFRCSIISASKRGLEHVLRQLVEQLIQFHRHRIECF